VFTYKKTSPSIVLEAITSLVGVYFIQLVIGVVYSQVGMTCVKEFVHMNN